MTAIPEKNQQHAIEILAKSFAQELVHQGFHQKDLVIAANAILDHAITHQTKAVSSAPKLTVIKGK
ncbi:MAG: hypothetical protein ACI86H_000790 [bacterium]|jgi:hypothetical protein